MRSELRWAYDGPVPKDYRISAAPADRDWAAWLLRKGSTRLNIGRRTWMLLPGRWYLIWHGEVIEQCFSEDAHLLSVRFHLSPPDGHCLFEGGPVYELNPQAALERQAVRLVRFTERHFREQLELWRQPASFDIFLGAQQLLAGWTQTLVGAMGQAGHVIRELASADERLRRAMTTLNAAELGQPWPAERLCRETSLTLRQLDRLFVANLGMTAHAFFERRRLERAREALGRHATPIKTLAYELGFRQLSHFSAWFSRHAGSSPRSYRTAMRPQQALVDKHST